MESAMSESLENLAGFFMFIGALVFIAMLSRTFSIADRSTAAQVKEKQSIIQTQDNIRNDHAKHPNPEHTLTGAEAFASMLFSDMPDSRTTYWVNNGGTTVRLYQKTATGYDGICDLPLAKEGNETEIQALRAYFALTANYKVKEVFAHSSDGDYISSVTYIKV